MKEKKIEDIQIFPEASETFQDNMIRSELFAVKILKYLFLFVFIYIFPYFLYELINNKIFKIHYIYLFVIIILISLYHFFISKKIINKFNIDLVKYFHVTIEITTVTVLLYFLTKCFNSEIILTGQLTMVYILMILFTGIRYKPYLSFYATLLAMIQFILYYSWAIKSIDPKLIDRLVDLGFGGLFQKNLYIFISGVISSYLAVYSKKIVFTISNEYNENLKIKETFGKYISNEIRDYILDNKTLNDNGDIVLGVVLFTDIRNFTSMMENNNPQNSVIQLNEYFNEMVKIINSNNGIVNKFIGDAIMAVFGIFNDKSNPEYNSIKASIEMQEALKLLNNKWLSEKKPTFKVGIGIDSGLLFIGNMGSDERKEFVCIGNTVNIAFEIQELTKKYGFDILLSENIARSENIENFNLINDSEMLCNNSIKMPIYCLGNGTKYETKE